MDVDESPPAAHPAVDREKVKDHVNCTYALLTSGYVDGAVPNPHIRENRQLSPLDAL